MAPPSFAFEQMRKAVLTLAVEHPALRSLINPRQTSAIEYSASPLNAASDPFQAGPAPGAALAECPLTLAGRRGDCDPTGRLFAMYGARAGIVYLVRPDGHVLWRWHDARDRPRSLADARAASAHSIRSSGARMITDSERDTVYANLCHTMTRIGETPAPLFLARFALLAIEAIGDAAVAERLIAEARDALPETPPAGAGEPAGR